MLRGLCVIVPDSIQVKVLDELHMTPCRFCRAVFGQNVFIIVDEKLEVVGIV